jgi:hypothetical protein
MPLEQPPCCTTTSFNLLILKLLVVFFRLQAVSWANYHLSSQTSSSASPPSKHRRPSNTAAPPAANLCLFNMHDYLRVLFMTTNNLQLACVRLEIFASAHIRMSQRKTAPKKATLSPFVGCAVGADLMGHVLLSAVFRRLHSIAPVSQLQAYH